MKNNRFSKTIQNDFPRLFDPKLLEIKWFHGNWTGRKISGGRDPPIFRFYPLAQKRRWIDKAAKSRRITGIVPGKRRCHGRWYKGRAPSSTERRGNLLYAAAHIAVDPWHFAVQLFLLRPRGPFPATFPAPADACTRETCCFVDDNPERNARVNLFLSIFFSLEEGSPLAPCPNFSLQRRIVIVIFLDFSFFWRERNVIIYLEMNLESLNELND